MLRNRCLVLPMYLQIRLSKPSNRLLIAWSTTDRGEREGGSPIQGLQNAEDVPHGREGRETCDSCRNPSAGNRSLVLAELGPPPILVLELTVTGEMSIEALPTFLLLVLH
jgi:hypothetical protein